MRRLISPAALVLIVALFVLPPSTFLVAPAFAHADLESSNPVADSTVAEAPLTLDLTFTEEVASGGVTVRVLGPAGDEVQAGTAEVDLNDPERRHVTLSLQTNLPPGRYTVEWSTTSNLDDHAETGSFAFSVGNPAASPAASPALVATPVGTPGAVASSVQAEATLDPDLNGNAMASEEGNFDSRGFALSVGAGLIAVVALVAFWRVVRPRNPVFGGRARG